MAATKPIPETLVSRYWRGQQSWEYEELIELAGHRLRIHINSDAYDSQSSAVCKRWDGNAWREVSRLASPVMSALHGGAGDRGPISYAARELTASAQTAFEADRDQLLVEARMVLGV